MNICTLDMGEYFKKTLSDVFDLIKCIKKDLEIYLSIFTLESYGNFEVNFLVLR